MANCEFVDSCSFFHEQTTTVPYTKEHLKSLYCTGVGFTGCAIHMIANIYGADKVPKHLYPNDVHKLLNFDLFAAREDSGRRQMVIYANGSSGLVPPSRVIELEKRAEIIACLGPNGWVEVRRKSNTAFHHANRRQAKPEDFYAQFYS